MAWVALTIKITLGIVGGLMSLGAVAYVADYGLEATITEVQCAGAGNPFFPSLLSADSMVTVQTQLFGVRHTAGLARDICAALRPNNYVVFHIRSGHTVIYQDSSKTRCLFDTESPTGVCQ